jgi:hypothetical protein
MDHYERFEVWLRENGAKFDQVGNEFGGEGFAWYERLAGVGDIPMRRRRHPSQAIDGCHSLALMAG